MAPYLLVAQGQAALKQDDGNGQGNNRKQQIAEHHFRCQKTQNRPGGNATRQQEKDGGHTHAPGKPLAEQ